jgi:DNA primase
MALSTVENIKSKIDVVDFLRGYITLVPAGKNFKALCPFHHEKSPSFMVSPERQSWHCFGCGFGGDIFTFLMKYENIEFGEALKILAEKAGIDLKRENPAEYKYSGLLYDLNNSAKVFFKNAFAETPVAQKYLEERGLKKETIEEFEIGWAPNEPEALSMFLLNSGSSPQDLLQAGLSIKTEKGLMLDRFRGRIMFPIHNHLRKVVGFTGRILPQFDRGDMGKYVNSPETPIFQKSKLLYGFWKSKDYIRAEKTAILVEGQMDFLMSFQSGVKNIVATSGTALTTDHLTTLHRFADQLILSFDNDVAGSDASQRAILLAESNDFSVKVATFKDFKDAADAAKADPLNVKKTFDSAVEAPEFFFNKYLPVDYSDFGSRDGILRIRSILEKLEEISSPISREFWMKKLSTRTGISSLVLQEEIDKMKDLSSPKYFRKNDENVVSQKENISRQNLISHRLIAGALSQNDFSILDDCIGYMNIDEREIVRILKTGDRKSDNKDLDQKIEIIVLKSSDTFIEKDINLLKNELKREYFKDRKNILTSIIKEAEIKKDNIKLNEALEELKSLQELFKDKTIE